MNNLQIPSQEEKKDFTIIYKGREDNNGEIIEKIDEIRTSKYLLIKSLRYFDEKKVELQYQDEIYIHDVYPNSIFKKFIESIQTKNISFPDEKTCMQYYDLSEKYGYKDLTDVLKKHIDERPDLKETIEQLSNEISSDEQIDPEKEEILSKHLDFCIKNSNLKKLPIQMIIRIINSPKRVLNNHHLLFQFVKEMIDFIKENDNKNSQYIPLFISSLDFNQMNVEEIKSLLNDEDSSDFPNPIDGIKCLLDEIKIKDEKINSFESKIDNLQKYLDENKKNEAKQKEEFVKLQNEFFEFKNNQFKLQFDSLKNFQQQLNGIHNKLMELDNLIKNGKKEEEIENQHIKSQLNLFYTNQQKLEQNQLNLKEQLNKIQQETYEFQNSVKKRDAYNDLVNKKQYQEQQAIFDKKIKDINNYYNEQINKIKETEKIERGKLENKLNQYLTEIKSENQNQNQNDMNDEEINEEEEEEKEDFSIDWENIGTTVFIRNIPYSATAKELCDFFMEKFGEVTDVRILQIIIKGKSYSRGMGYVEFKTEDSCKKALLAQNVEFKAPNDQQPKRLVILQARPKRKHNTAFIKGIPPGTTDEDINNAFKLVKPIQILIGRYDNERSLGFALMH